MTTDFDSLLDEIKEDDRARVAAERRARQGFAGDCKSLIAETIRPYFERVAAGFAGDDVLQVAPPASGEDNATLAAVNQRDGRTYELSYRCAYPSLEMTIIVRHPIGGRLEHGGSPRRLTIETLSAEDIVGQIEDFLRYALRGVGRQF